MSNEKFELNLSEMKEYISNVLRFFIHFLKFILLILRKKILVIFPLFLVVLFSLYFLLAQSKNEYEVKMSCVYNDNHQRIFGEMLQQLDILLKAKEYEKLSVILQMEVNLTKQVKSIQGKTLSLGKLEEDYSKNKEPFYIYSTVYNTSILPELEEKIIQYLNNNALSQRAFQKQKEKWGSRIKFYENQIIKLDSLKEVIKLSYLSNSNRIDLAQQNNSVVDVYKLSDTMSFYLDDFKYYFEHYKTVEKIYGFMPTNIPSAQKVFKKSLVYATIFLVMIWGIFCVIPFARELPNNSEQ